MVSNCNPFVEYEIDNFLLTMTTAIVTKLSINGNDSDYQNNLFYLVVEVKSGSNRSQKDYFLVKIICCMLCKDCKFIRRECSNTT